MIRSLQVLNLQAFLFYGRSAILELHRNPSVINEDCFKPNLNGNLPVVLKIRHDICPHLIGMPVINLLITNPFRESTLPF